MNSAIKRVFISYAHDDETTIVNDVWELGGWLTYFGNKTIEVITDHLYKTKPPRQGWYVWMNEELAKADVVLIVCTPKYEAAFLKEQSTQVAARGVAFEGIIITAGLFGAIMDNEKYYPILPDAGQVLDIPLVLRQYYNNNKFPSGYNDILNLIIGENPTYKDYVPNQSTAQDNSQEELITLESEIVNEVVNNEQDTMLSSIQIVVRAFLSLSSLEQVSIMQKMNFFDETKINLLLNERNKSFFEHVREHSKLELLWEKINEIKPFENKENPFKR